MNLTTRACLLLVILGLVVQSSAAVITVQNTLDSGAGSLRQALATAKAQGGSTTIAFAPALSGQTITLTEAIVVNDTFGPTIDVTLDASALVAGLTISGNHDTRIFSQGNSSSNFTLRGLSLVNGNSENDGGAIGNSGALTLVQCTFSGNSARYAGAINHGGGTLTMTGCLFSANNARDGDSGAIYIGNDSTVLASGCTFSGNSASGIGAVGGAIYLSSGGTLTMSQCVLVQNSSGGSWDGGALYNDRGTVSLTECTLERNQSGGSGGAILNDIGNMTLTRCTLDGNSAAGGFGGAIYNASGTLTLTLKQCTLTENFTGSSGGGGAIYNHGVLLATHCTIAGNHAGSGGGGGVFNPTFGQLSLANSILAGNSATSGSDLFHDANQAIQGRGNLIGSNETAGTNFPPGMPNANGDYVGSAANPLSPMLAPLADRGGPTKTMALLPASLARNRAMSLSPPLTTDQRGYPILREPDIGAVENQFGVSSRTLLIPNGADVATIVCTLEVEGTVTASSSNQALIANASIAIPESGLSREITITPGAGLVGRSTITLTQAVSGESDTFEVYLLPQNYAEATVSDIHDQIMDEDSGTLQIPFEVGDAASEFGLTVNVASSNPKLVPDANIAVSGSGAGRQLAITPLADESGVATIFVTVSDGATTAIDEFILMVRAVNDAPHFTKGADQLIFTGRDLSYWVPAWATGINHGATDENGQTLGFIVSNDSPALFTVQPMVSSSGDLTFTPERDVEGTATILVSLKDNGGTANGGKDTSAPQTLIIRLVSLNTPAFVTTVNDSGVGSLREAIFVASSRPGADVITFASDLSGQTMLLQSAIPTYDADGVTVDATALPAGLTLSGGYATRIFQNGGILTLKGIQMIRGNGMGPLGSDYGGAIFNHGTLTLDQCSLSENAVKNGAGGAIHNTTSDLSATVTLTRCTFFGNSAGQTGSGGAISNRRGGPQLSVVVTQCTFFGNSSVNRSGGAINNFSGDLKLVHCTVSGNIARTGGGIAMTLDGPLTLSNSIVTGNFGSDGGPDVYRSTGSLAREGVNLVGINHTVTSAFPAGRPNSHGNYVGTTAAPLDARLAELGNYGGHTKTLPLLVDSVARDRASAMVPAITSDQRGFPIVGTPDVGAYEGGTTNSFAIWSAEQAGAVFSFHGDFDGNGKADGLDYATRTIGGLRNVSPLLAQLPGAAGMQLSFPYRPGAGDLRYILQRSATLADWTEIYRYQGGAQTIAEAGVSAEVDAESQIIKVTDAEVGPRLFWRLLVEPVP